MTPILKDRLELEIKQKSTIYEGLKFDKKINKYPLIDEFGNLTERDKISMEHVIYPKVELKYKFNFIFYMNGVDWFDLIHKVTCESMIGCVFDRSFDIKSKIEQSYECLFIKIHKSVCKEACIFICNDELDFINSCKIQEFIQNNGFHQKE